MEINFNAKGRLQVGQPISPFRDIASTAKEVAVAGRQETDSTLTDDDAFPSLTIESSLEGGAEVLLTATSSPSSVAKTIQMDQKMTLKILRGRNLPAENPHIRICRVKDGESVDIDILGKASGNSCDPIWGGSTCTWTVLGNDATELVFLLFKDASEEDYLARAWVQVSDLLRPKNQLPNIWLGFDEQPLAQIQVCLSISRVASLHPQENCLRITPGPALPPLSSYRIRKMALWSCGPVMLNVYDVSNNTRIEKVNKYIKAVGAGGIFHAAIEIFGKEYSFGVTLRRNTKVTGIFACEPKQCPMHHYRESVYLGDCDLTPAQVERILEDLRPQWLASSYNIFRKNCCFFSREFAIQLGVGDIPEWVYSLATSAEFIEPYAIKLNEYLAQRTKATTNTKTTPAETKTLASENQPPNSKEQPKQTHEAMLDHAMAARIQQSSRHVSAIKHGQSKRKSITWDC
jgi:hypothetical protein